MGIGRRRSQARLDSGKACPDKPGQARRFKRLPFMADSGLAKTIDDAFEQRNDIGPSTRGPVRQAVEAALDLLDRGEARVAEKQPDNSWRVNQWLKKAVLLSFRLNDMA